MHCGPALTAVPRTDRLVVLIKKQFAFDIHGERVCKILIDCDQRRTIFLSRPLPRKVGIASEISVARVGRSTKAATDFALPGVTQ